MYLNIKKILKNSILHKIPRKRIIIKSKYKFVNLVLLLILFSCTEIHACGPGRGIGGPRRNRKLTPLVFKQHVPNMSENTLGASGLQEGKIKRDHQKFKDLVPNYNRDIIFKDEEGTGADRLMTQRCKEKLNTLAVSVMNQWPGVRLRVTESWDEDYLHGPDSLHYEGRAVDITTSDRDRSKYGMLARLAVEAGFDWVYYESRAHIHCSVKSDSSQSSHISGCFSADSTVLTSTGIHRKLNELEIGEKVLTMKEDGSMDFSEVMMFLDRDTEETREFVKIRTDGNATLTVTPAHLVMVWNPKKELMNFIFADKIEEGDFVLVNNLKNNRTLEPQRVVEISTTLSRGVFAPLTKEGTIIVNSVAASCYALINSQNIAHWSFMPIRLVDSIWHWFSSIESSTNRKKREHERKHQSNGIHWYAKALFSIKNFVLPKNWIYH